MGFMDIFARVHCPSWADVALPIEFTCRSHLSSLYLPSIVVMCVYTHIHVYALCILYVSVYTDTHSILVRELRTVSYILHCTRTTPRKGQNTKLIRIRDSLAPVPSERLAREKNLRIYI